MIRDNELVSKNDPRLRISRRKDDPRLRISRRKTAPEDEFLRRKNCWVVLIGTCPLDL